ncbi:hypothetical protein [Campylobacter ureolyticus]|jgi:hypothetical protein|uniref:hypothetical protein n=1 Tax=Campylobacter ureolyticus TaxID=827 RepID=UPI0022B47AD3|nr:hypothetical protein [Campylobacter ureolyticus]MCZ6116384.1 hypothetical protein [Campylobacter ureolyticus]
MGNNILIDKMKPEEFNYSEKVDEIKKGIKNLDQNLYKNFNQMKSLEHKIENFWNDLEKAIKEVEKNLAKRNYEDSKQIKNDIEGLKNLILDSIKRINITNNNGSVRTKNIIESIKVNIKFHIRLLYFLIAIDIIIRIFAYI